MIRLTRIRFKTFTDRALRIIALAEREARLLNHSELNTGHILIAIIAEGHWMSTDLLEGSRLTKERATKIFIALNPASTQQLPEGHRFLIANSCPNFMKAAHIKARELNHRYVGAEDLLLGLLQDKTNIACQMLRLANIDPDKVRQKLLAVLGQVAEQ